MNINKFLVSGLVGGIVIFAIGFLVYGLVLESFFVENTQNAQAIMKNPPNFILLILGQFFFGFLLAYIFMQWAGIKTSATGARAGAIIGLLMGLSYTLTSLGTQNIFTPGSAVAEIVTTVLQMMGGGAAVGFMLGRDSK